ncbi:expressed protein [Phakopsora pachyrhizi]|uniref:Expressed protein n=1 Tax=Phakopsora pachyrhizi TaxID=170000 RepID=A0AAV0BVC3_PHAPC|nr:expressed protein [Phakopsora pachyrhizi]
MKNQNDNCGTNISSRALRARRPAEAHRIDLLSMLSRRCKDLKLTTTSSSTASISNNVFSTQVIKDKLKSSVEDNKFDLVVKSSHLSNTKSNTCNTEAFLPASLNTKPKIGPSQFHDHEKFSSLKISNSDSGVIPIIIIDSCVEDQDSSENSLNLPSTP